MRLYPETALVVCLCLWIPVARSHSGELAPEDQDGSGDDEDFFGSGSGDDDLFLIEPEGTTQASPNTTKPAWFTDAPVNLPEHTVTQFATLDTEPETSGHITEAPYTTPITQTTLSPVIIKSLDSEEDQNNETTTVSEVAQPETTVPPAEKLPVVPIHLDEYTTTAYDEETKESSIIDQEDDETPVLFEVGTVTTVAPDMETTPLFLSRTSSSNFADADAEASGDAVESITAHVIEGNFLENHIPEHHEPIPAKPTMIDDDFGFEGNEIKSRSGSGLGRPGSESDFARGSTSDNDSLLERKEVLAGVIAGGVVGLAFAIMLVALMVYRMKKKDEGSYSLDEHKHPNGGYQKPQKQEEFLA